MHLESSVFRHGISAEQFEDETKSLENDGMYKSLFDIVMYFSSTYKC